MRHLVSEKQALAIVSSTKSAHRLSRQITKSKSEKKISRRKEQMDMHTFLPLWLSRDSRNGVPTVRIVFALCLSLHTFLGSSLALLYRLSSILFPLHCTALHRTARLTVKRIFSFFSSSPTRLSNSHSFFHLTVSPLPVPFRCQISFWFLFRVF